MGNKYLERIKNIPSFSELEECQTFGTTQQKLDIMQVNIGKKCNLACKHCHIEAGPNRMEMMSRDVMAACLEACKKNQFRTLDITGGAPEMNPDLEWFVREAAKHGIHTIVRSNLAILNEEGCRHLPEFYAQNKVELVGSLPYYTEKDTDRQRGKGVFASCVAMLRELNGLGYGRNSALILNLVYNPGGAFLPPDQESLAVEYRKKLSELYGITFNNLYTITNNPIGRFGDFLDRSGNLAGYMDRLVSAFNPASVENMMCRNQISVDWDGTIYDCDFNLALGLTANVPYRIQDLADTGLSERKIVFGNHCYACTAGAGSSCGGATA
ncbi:radical SAM/Cys-rich domain-containing protein [Sporobacter termitidis DSM 10068]|uniref:Radical SAM/Cys-rich domain-containing protein n=1 Tax=Sporobacter termitidis DSM 10068 TaxID=1123282 RepID=A0A1M5WAI5_9FIRM|nr:arsenosugar biosynthesis radical SAM (seleno)protein ArsS [Sporobacter termitidis]SHH84477.1 radical SAM/Cys-rich domain-containing protein [Sporobacter termitidis DSM 10068]